MSSYDPARSFQVNYEYNGITGIVRAVNNGHPLLTGVAPDDENHSPVSGKWELYLISVPEGISPVNLGDVNEDGFINITDVTVLINYLLTDTWSEER